MRTRAKYGWMLIGLLVVLVASPAYGQALWRNFFTTNQNPVVDVVAGSNATVQATTVGVNTRRFTVNSVPPSQLPYTVITNSPWMTNGSPVYATNVVSGGQLPAGTVASVAAPADGWMLGSSNGLRNWTLNAGMMTNLNGSNVVGPVTSSTYVTNAQTAELQVVRPLVVQPFTAGTAPFDLGLVSAQNTGGGAGTYNHGAWLGFNAGRHSGAPVVAKRGIMMGLEDNYFDATGDGQYANEWYVEGWSPDGTTVQMSRPFYARGAQEDNGTNWWTILCNIGTLGANRQFSVRSGNTNLFTITPTGITCSNATTIFGQVTTSGSGAQFAIKLNLTDSVNRRNWALQTEVNNVGDLVFVRSPTNGTSQPSITSLEITRDGKVGISNTAPVAVLDVGGDIRAATTITATNGFTSGASASNYLATVGTTNLFLLGVPTNGVAPPTSVAQPIGLFGCMMMTATNTVTVGSSGTYYTVTNYGTVRTNGFVANAATGYLTNQVAGYYRITMYLSCYPGNSDMLEGELNVSGSGKEEISFFGQFDNPARVRTISSTGLLYLPANSYLCMQVNNRSGANNVTIWRGALTVSSP